MTACTRLRTPSLARMRATCVLAVASLMNSRAQISGLDSTRSMSADGQQDAQDEAARGARAGLELAAVERDPLLDADQAVTAAGQLGGRVVPVVDDLQLQRPRRVPDVHPHPRGRRA